MPAKGLLLAFLGLALVSTGVAVLRRPATAPLPTLRVQVLNGCGEAGLAARVGAHLRTLDQDVVEVTDASHHDHPRTVLVDRVGRPDLARRLADALGGPLVVLERREGVDSDVTLILGADHARFRLASSRP